MAGWSVAQILEMIILVGWYHLILLVANTARADRREPRLHLLQHYEELVVLRLADQQRLHDCFKEGVEQ